MSSLHKTEHEEVLERVVCGELLPDSREIQELAAGCPECAESLRELSMLGRQLDRVGADERALIEEAISGKSAEDEAAVAEGLSKAWEAEGGAASRHHWFRSLILAAAGLLLVFGGWRMIAGTEDSPVEPQLQQWLGVADSGLVKPVGLLEGLNRSEGFAEFSWDVPTTPGDTFTLRVWNLDESEPVIVEERLRESIWRPSQEELERLDVRIRWQVDQYEILGETVRSIEGRAAVSRR